MLCYDVEDWVKLASFPFISSLTDKYYRIHLSLDGTSFHMLSLWNRFFYTDLSLYLYPDISLSVMYWTILRNAFLKTLNYHQRNVFVQHYKTSLTHHRGTHFSQLYPSGRFFQVWSDLLGKKITSMTSAVKKYYLSNKLTLLQFFKLTFLLHRHGICSGPADISSHNEALEVTTSQSSMKFSEDKSRHGAE